jgi:hypothetical protein
VVGIAGLVWMRQDYYRFGPQQQHSTASNRHNVYDKLLHRVNKVRSTRDFQRATAEKPWSPFSLTDRMGIGPLLADGQAEYGQC